MHARDQTIIVFRKVVGRVVAQPPLPTKSPRSVCQDTSATWVQRRRLQGKECFDMSRMVAKKRGNDSTVEAGCSGSSISHSLLGQLVVVPAQQLQLPVATVQLNVICHDMLIKTGPSP
jgi:hypothetical protein